MTSHTGRIYAVALALVVFFVAWAVVAARPWRAAAAADPRLKLLAVRQSQLQREVKLVQQLSAARRVAVHAAPAVASAPAVRIVNLPPLTITRTS